jgi:hypothetical protein
MNNVRPANADIPDGLDPVINCYVESVAGGDTTDVAWQPLGLGSGGHRQERSREQRTDQRLLVDTH